MSADEVVLLGPFEGISAMRVAWCSLGLACLGHVAIENCPHAKRVVSSEWPDVLHYKDVREVGEKEVQSWREQFPGARHVVSVAGFPCQDLSAANTKRGGLSGKRSSLFWELCRLWKTLRKVWRGVRLHRCAENVQRMPPADERQICSELKLPAVAVCASLFSWTKRPRLFWLDWRPHDGDGLQIVEVKNKEGWQLKVTGAPDRGPVRAWLGGRNRWPGASEEPPRALPTLMRWEPKRSPPVPAHGEEGCTPEEWQAWADSGFAVSPYQFQRRNCVERSDGRCEPPGVAERERLMGFPSGYTLGALTSSEAKLRPGLEFATRASLLGNSIQVDTLAWLLSHLATDLGYLTRMPSRHELRSGTVRELVADAGPGLGESGTTRAREYSDEERLSALLMSRAGSKGSDVRIATGQLMRPMRGRFMGTKTEWWRWKVSFGFKWRRPAHINELEVRAALLDLQRRTRHRAAIGGRYLLLLDSYVALGVLSKKRSSSARLHRVLRRFDALELAGGMKPYFAYVRSAKNPADRPSRRFRKSKAEPTRSRGERHRQVRECQA